MGEDDPGGYALLWLAELGAYVPEHHDGSTTAPRERGFGLALPEDERARRHSRSLAQERRARRA